MATVAFDFCHAQRFDRSPTQTRQDFFGEVRADDGYELLYDFPVPSRLTPLSAQKRRENVLEFNRAVDSVLREVFGS